MTLQPYGYARGNAVDRTVAAIVDFTLDAWLYVRDVLPILAKYQAIQWTRDAIRRAPFLLESERRVLLNWLRSHGW